MGKPSRKGDDASGKSPLTLEAIMAEHQEAIRRYVERQGFHGADRDDLVQEIFHGAARSLPRFDPRLGSMRTWLLRIAFNLITHERKRAHRRYEALWPEEALDELSSDAPDSETRLIEAQRGEILAELLLSVPPARGAGGRGTAAAGRCSRRSPPRSARARRAPSRCTAVEVRSGAPIGGGGCSLVLAALSGARRLARRPAAQRGRGARGRWRRRRCWPR
ncbi:RNA polymerase sigma factor [Sorangium sp. So ce315]|uniref:RNA polymerase sigma factor n=1 Tax=Sorangium sp. So ce315 TaxID=3133299 RepID=UPI003F612E6C